MQVAQSVPTIFLKKLENDNSFPQAVDLGNEGTGRPFPSGIRPYADPKGPPFCTILRYTFWLTEPKIFLKALLAPKYTKFEGGSARRKPTAIFCSKISIEPLFLACFFFKQKENKTFKPVFLNNRKKNNAGNFLLYRKFTGLKIDQKSNV